MGICLAMCKSASLQQIGAPKLRLRKLRLEIQIVCPSSIFRTSNKLMHFQVSFKILTYFAYIANVKKSCSIVQQFTGRKCVTQFGAVL